MKEIKLEFMVAGHSFMPCDRAFGNIEKEFKRYPKIECPEQYFKAIGDARKDFPVNVIKMSSKDFYDFKPLKDYVTVRKLTNDMMFSKGRTFTMDSTNPWSYLIEQNQRTARQNLCKFVRLPPVKGAGQAALEKQRKETPSILLSDVQLKRPYEGIIIKLDDTKRKHLSQLSNYLDEEGEAWAENLLKLQNTAIPVDDTPEPEELPQGQENMQDEDQEDFIQAVSL